MSGYFNIDPSVVAAIRKAATPRFNRWAKRETGYNGRQLLAKITMREFGGRSTKSGRGVVSSAGARGPFQFIPSTRAAYKSRYGIDPWKNDVSAAKAAVIHLLSSGVQGYSGGGYDNSDLAGFHMDKKTKRLLYGANGPQALGGKGGTKLSLGSRPKVVGKAAHFNKRGFALDYLQREDKNEDLGSFFMRNRESYNVPSTLRVKPGKLDKTKVKNGVKGLQLPKGSGKIYEVFYDPDGVYYDNGGLQKGAIGNHSDHVHVSADEKYVVKLGKLAQRMGLHVGENPHFGGVAPVHVNGSFHYKNMAIDVSGDAAKMHAFAKRIRHLAVRGHGG